MYATYFLIKCCFHWDSSNPMVNFCKRQLFMTDILPNIGLSRLFSNRIKHYLLFLQVTNNIELICEITDYLNIREILNFLSTSRYIYSFAKIHTIEIRLLQAKVDYYERPTIQPTFQTFINFVQVKVPAAQTKIKSQKLARDYESFKKIYKQMLLSKIIKKLDTQSPATIFQKTQLSVPKQTGNTRNQITVKNQKPPKNNSYPHPNQHKPSTPPIQKIPENTLNANKKKQNYNNINPFYQKFQEVEYILAKEDFERRKLKRLQQQKEKEQFMTIQELKKMAVEEPTMREIIHKIQIEETQKIQRANRDKLKMKPIKIDKHAIQKLKMLQEQQKQKLMVVKESIAQKLFSNIRSFVQKP